MTLRATAKKRAEVQLPNVPVERLASKNNQKLGRRVGFRKRKCHAFPGVQPLMKEALREEGQQMRE